MAETLTSSSAKAVSPISSQAFLSAKPVFCCQLDGKGGAIPVTQDTQATVSNPCWVHLDYLKPETIAWINQTPLLPDIARSILTSKNQQPKELRLDVGMLAVLKGVNVTPNNQPDPIVTLRFYITDNLIISTRHQKINAINELQEDLKKQVGPVDVADWLVQLSDIIAEHANASVENVHSQVIKLEDGAMDQKLIQNKDIGRVRRQLVILRRLLSPQRDVYVRISTERLSWIDDHDRQHMHDIATRLSYSVEDIDACLFRLSSLMELINAMLTESTNKRIYLMSLFAMIFMPITFLTSLFGINLSGMPYSESPLAFGIFSGVLIMMTIIFIFWLRRRKWL
ncbi:zinc transporter ZntB [Zophobihabitans entericus]|uniref:Zinc transporter ZntB n=1 Tax=Zophobihabitans entericus TaxID=1635327 RepID=A0A6G9IBV0_9GAMM|nr:zinc transporter ZntB [Zophobihabitans entericus]QIQ21299.1 zinc transporter ZntB [Zophobihabitans entericus]